jgi:hypothetical protein
MATLTGTNRSKGGLAVAVGTDEAYGVDFITFSGATLTNNGNGRITLTISGGGGGGITSFNIAGATGSSAVGDGQTVTVTGSGGITTAESSRTVTVSPTGVLEDLNTLDAPTADGEFIVATGAGAFQYETGATVRTSLGLGTMATQNASGVAITGGSISGITDLAVTDGGTGAGTAAGARTNLGLGTMATQNSDAVAITGGVVSSLFNATLPEITAGGFLDVGDLLSGYVLFGVPSGAGAVNFNLANVTAPGFQITIVNTGTTNPVNINANGGGQSINGVATVALSTQYNAVSIVTQDGVNFVAIGV